jgi:alkylation response protein AidB-like acyl-CoA dehydrogenase
MTLSTHELNDFREVVSAFLDARAPIATVHERLGRDLDAELWKGGVELGWSSLLVPEEQGGEGLGMQEATMIAAELGARLVRFPFLSSVVLASSAIGLAADTTAATGRLEALATGERTGAVVLDWLDAETGAGGWRLRGATAPTVDPGADFAVVPVRHDESRALLVVDIASDGVAIEQIEVVDETRAVGRLRFEDQEFGGDAELLAGDGAAVGLEGLVRLADLTLAAESSGGAETALASTVEYAKDRVQFGRPIGSFQAIKHKLATMYALSSTVAAAVPVTARLFDLNDPDAADATIALALRAHEAYVAVSGESVQVHGGVAMTFEHSAHLHFRRAWTNRALFGGRDRLEAAYLAEWRDAGAAA